MNPPLSLNTSDELVAANTVELTSNQFDRQRHRERSVDFGFKSVKRYRPKQPQNLVEEAILNLLTGIGARQGDTIDELRQHLRTVTLAPFQKAISDLLSTRVGKPANFKSFWRMLELPISQNSGGDSFSKFTEIVFYSTLHEMLISVVSPDPHEKQINKRLQAERGTVDPSGSNEVESPTITGYSDSDWPWTPEIQLFQRVWNSFEIELVHWLSNQKTQLPSWLADSVRRSSRKNHEAFEIDVDLEACLERAFHLSQTLKQPKPRQLGDALRKTARKNTTVRKSSLDNDDSMSGKPFAEAAHEFAAWLVSSVADIAGDGTFRWFTRSLYVLPNGKVPHGYASWIPTHALLDRLDASEATNDIYQVPLNSPLIVPPRDWYVNSLYQGGYYTHRLSFYKFYKKNDRIRDFLQLCQTPALVPVLDTVNQIQSTPFRINQRLWSVVNGLIERADHLASNRSVEDKQNTPLDDYIRESFSPHAFDRNATVACADRLNDYRIATKRSLTYKVVNDLTWRKNDDGENESFYFAYQADTRGRLYPVSHWLSPQGEDLPRALLEFARGKPITESGAHALAIHGSHQVRFETILKDLKIEQEQAVTLVERRRWIDVQEENIRRFAADPFSNNDWTKVKNPFAFLAFCFAWTDYLDNGPNVVSHLPVHVDGVCNGLQHIAALTGNADLAALTNLRPGDPRDIYLYVKKLVIQHLTLIRHSDPYADFALDSNFVDRGLAKSVVMIIPYGASDYGMREVVRNAIRDLMIKGNLGSVEITLLGNDFIAHINRHYPQSIINEVGRLKALDAHLWKLAKTIQNAFKEQFERNFPAIGQFMTRVKDSVNEVCAANLPIVWQSPSGFPVIQNNFDVSIERSQVRISGPTLGDLDLGRREHSFKFRTQRVGNKIDQKQQKNGIVPNLIHSMDSAHLVRTIQLAVGRGISNFSVVHDSFGVHAADMTEMAQCIREAFLLIYGKETISPLTRFLQWLAVLSIASRAPRIHVDAFASFITLTPTEKAMYDMVAGWAGRDSALMIELSKEAPKLIEKLIAAGSDEVKVRKKTDQKILLFAADQIELEWPQDEVGCDISDCLKATYFFS